VVGDLEREADRFPAVQGKHNVTTGHSMDWEDYHPMEDMYSYMDHLEQTVEFVTIQSIGKSFEGQDMRVLSVCRGGCGHKPAIWVDGGIHAREWIAPAVATFLVQQLVEYEHEHPDLTQLLDWHFLPVMNPDGYRWSQGADRYWRKTRTENEPWLGTGICMGTDANRNWGFHWNTGGASAEPCDESFMGSAEFSEVENRNVRDFLLANNGTIKLYNSLHSYGEMVLLPWGFTESPPANYPALLGLAETAAAALMAVHGTEFEVGCIPCLLYPASGGTIDWALGVAGIPYTMAMELRGSPGGWALPPEYIRPSGEEVWAFHTTAAQLIIDEFSSPATSTRQP